MRYKYVVILKNDRERATDAISVLLCLFSAAIFLKSSYRHIPPNYPGVALAAVLLIGLAVNLMLARRTPKQGYRSAPPVRYRYWLLLSAVGWFALTTTPWFGGFFVLFSFLEYQSKRPLEIGFDDDRIVINHIVRQWHEWSAFNNVILKDGLLTLDFKNNRLVQKEVAEDDEEDDAGEEEFNAFCRGRLIP